MDNEMKLSDEYQTCVVTGGAGFIGRYLCEELLKQERQVVCIDNFCNAVPESVEDMMGNPLFTLVAKDISRDSIKAAFAGADVVFHQACSKCGVCRDVPQIDLMTNAWGSWRVFHTARELGVKKIVHASSGSVNNGKPNSFYGVTKLAGESYLRAFAQYHADFKYSVLRYYHVYGPRQNYTQTGGVIPIFISKVLKGEPTLVFGGNQVRHFTHVKDVVAANILAANSSKLENAAFDVVSDVKITIKDLAVLIHELMETEPIAIEQLPSQPGDIAKFDLLNTPIKLAGMIFMNDLEAGLLETIEWYRSRIT